MANTKLIKQKLPKELWELANKFNIADSFLENKTELAILILRSKSLAKNEEKQSWFDLIPIMNEDQILKLKDILTREKNKIAEIEAKYEKKKDEIKKKYHDKFNATQYNEKMAKMKLQEASFREKEMAEADDLLENI